MRIQMLASVAGLDFSYAGNETPDVSDECAKSLVEAGHAAYIDQPEEKQPAPAKPKKAAAKKSDSKNPWSEED